MSGCGECGCVLPPKCSQNNLTDQLNPVARARSWFSRACKTKWQLRIFFFSPILSRKKVRKEESRGGCSWRVHLSPEDILSCSRKRKMEEEDLYAGPLADRVESGNWKVRRAAYEELAQKFKESVDNGIFFEYGTRLAFQFIRVMYLHVVACSWGLQKNCCR